MDSETETCAKCGRGRADRYHDGRLWPGRLSTNHPYHEFVAAPRPPHRCYACPATFGDEESAGAHYDATGHVTTALALPAAAPHAAPREGEPTLDVGSDRYERTPTGWTRHAHGRRYTVQAPYGAVLDALASQQAALDAAGEAEKALREIAEVVAADFLADGNESSDHYNGLRDIAGVLQAFVAARASHPEARDP